MRKQAFRCLAAVALAAILAAALFTGCQRKDITQELVLPEDMKLVDVEWHTAGAAAYGWYLVRPMHPEDQAETYIFENFSGTETIIIREAKTE